MAAPNPSMLIFPRIPVLGGYLETRIMRLSSYAIDAWNTPFLPLGISPPPLNPYIWDKKFPGDAIFLDDKTCGDILYMGDEQNPMPIDYSTKDELAGIYKSFGTIKIDFLEKTATETSFLCSIFSTREKR